MPLASIAANYFSSVFNGKIVLFGLFKASIGHNSFHKIVGDN